LVLWATKERMARLGLKVPQECQDWLEKWEIRVNMA